MYLQASMIIILLVGILAIVLLKQKEHFIENECGFFYEHTLDEDAKTYVKYLVTVALKDINKKGHELYPLNLERMTIRESKNKGFLDYKIYYFVNSWTHFSNRKLLFDLSVHEDDGILIINRIMDGESLKPVLPRQKDNERGSELYKPKQTFLPKASNNSSVLEFNLTKDTGLRVPLGKRLLTLPVPGEEKACEPFPVRQIVPVWDSYGISDVKNKGQICNGGIFRGAREEDKKVVGTNNPTLFFRKDETYDKLFSLTEDAASRPIGIA
mgnify:FL=1